MSPESHDEFRELLIRIDERVKAVQVDIQQINDARSCATHAEKIKTLERMVWGTVTVLVGLVVRVAYETFR